MTNEEKSNETNLPSNKKRKLIDKDGFTLPKSPRKTRRYPKGKTQPLNIISKNPYEDLSDSDMSVEEKELKVN